MEGDVKGEALKALVKMDIELEVRDKNGKLIEFRRQKSDSFVKGLIGLLRGIFRCVAGSAMTDEPITELGGASKNFFSQSYGTPGGFGRAHACNAPAGNAAYGLIVGTGTTPVTMTDVALATKIAHGSGSGQLNYGAHTVDASVIDSTTAKFNFVRTFSNASGAAITVNEIGIYLSALDSAEAQWYICIARDIISGGVSVPNGSTLTVRYIPTISTT